MEQPIAQSLRLAFGELAVEHEGLGPDDQVVREHLDLQPDLVERERFERELGEPGVFIVARTFRALRSPGGRGRYRTTTARSGLRGGQFARRRSSWRRVSEGDCPCRTPCSEAQRLLRSVSDPPRASSPCLILSATAETNWSRSSSRDASASGQLNESSRPRRRALSRFRSTAAAPSERATRGEP